LFSLTKLLFSGIICLLLITSKRSGKELLLTTNIRIKSKNKIKIVILKELTKNSKDLYNKALYTIRQHFFSTGKYLPYTQVYHKLKSSEEYKRLPSNASQQTLRQVDNNFKSFFQLLKAKDHHKVHIPRYLDKNGHYKVIYTKIHFKVMDNNYVRLTLPNYIREKYGVRYLYFKVPKHIQGKEIKELHILPYKPYYKLSFAYSDGDKNYNHYTTDDIMAIDIGIDNLATVVTRYNKPIILDGKSLKSKNRYFNKKISVLLSSITKGKNPKEWDKKAFKRLNLWYQRRENYVRDYLHKVAVMIINMAIEKGIKTIVIGYNKNWKNKCNIGRKNNEKFLSIPHSKLLEYIKYKAIQHKIEVIEQEESYTSKCDALALESVQKHDKYLGKRVSRGLFQSSVGKLINADVNGALNILRKSVACDSLVKEIAGRGLVFQPVRVYIHPYKPSHKRSSTYNAA